MHTSNSQNWRQNYLKRAAVSNSKPMLFSYRQVAREVLQEFRKTPLAKSTAVVWFAVSFV